MADVRPILQRTSAFKNFFSHQTYITSQAASGVGTLTVKNINNFAINQVLLIGKLGAEGSEIIKTHASTAPSGTTVTLAANLANTHPIYTKVTVILFDQIEFSHTTTATGAKNPMVSSIQATITTSSANTTFTATRVTDASAWTLSAVAVGMIAKTSGGNYGLITAVSDASDYVDVSAWLPSTPTDGETVTIHSPTSIPADNEFTRLDDLVYTSGFYFVRYRNSITNDYSDYIGAIPYAGMGENTVRQVIDKALVNNKLDSFTDKITQQFCLDQINESLRFITGRLKNARWSKLQTFGYVLGQTARGTYSYTLPSDIWENENNKSIIRVYLGANKNASLRWKSKNEFDNIMADTILNTVRTAASAADTSLLIDNSYDFADDGTVNVYISGTKYAITYTGVTRSATAGVLTGVPASGTGSITVTIAADTNVWQDETEGTPTFYTVYGNTLYLYPITDVSNDNMNVILDYYTAPTSVDTDEDELDVFRYDACTAWLTWKIRMLLKNDGVLDLQDGDYTIFVQNINDYINGEKPAHLLSRKTKIVSLNT